MFSVLSYEVVSGMNECTLGKSLIKLLTAYRVILAALWCATGRQLELCLTTINATAQICPMYTQISRNTFPGSERFSRKIIVKCNRSTYLHCSGSLDLNIVLKRFTFTEKLYNEFTIIFTNIQVQHAFSVLYWLECSCL